MYFNKNLVLGLLGAIVTAGSTAQNSSAVLEEVIVTAQKRTQSLQDVPISVSVVSGEELAATGTRSFEDLRSATPGLYISGARDGQAQGVTIRGVGSQAFTDVQRPNVGIFVDGVPKKRLDGAFSQMLDLAGVEVLKGPQSTLYGKEVSAGAVLMTTNKPVLDSLEGSIDVSFGSDDIRDYKGIINVPISDTLAARVALYHHEKDEQIINIMSGDEGHLKNTGGRLRLLWQPSDEFQAILSYEYHESEVRDSVSERVTYGTGSAGIAKTLPADPFDRKVESAIYQGRSSENTTTSLYMEWQINDAWSLNSISSFNEFYRFQAEGGCVDGFTHPTVCGGGAGGDGAYLPEPVLVFGDPKQKDRTYTQEFRLSYESDNLNSQVGVFYNDYRNTFGGNSILLPLIPVPPVGFPLYNNQRADDQDFSIYTHNTYSFNEQWDVIFGLSYSGSDRERKRYSNVFAGQFAAFPRFPETFTAFWDSSWDNTSGTLKAVYALNDDVSFYGGLATGYRPGGFNNNGPDFDKETSDAWELGMKGVFYDGRLRFNAAAFLQTFDDYQVQSFDLAEGALGNIFTNAAEVKITGIEADFSWLANEHMTVNGAVSYVDAEYDKFEGSGCNFSQTIGAQGGCQTVTTPGGTILDVQDLSGERLANNSPLTYNINGVYRGTLSSGIAWFIRGDVIYRDDSSSYTNLEPLTKMDDYTLVNARLGFIAADETWEVSLWGRNLTDEDYLTGMLPGRDGPNNGDGLVGFLGEETTYGVDLRYNFSAN